MQNPKENMRELKAITNPTDQDAPNRMQTFLLTDSMLFGFDGVRNSP
jgi:hypothetical protein